MHGNYCALILLLFLIIKFVIFLLIHATPHQHGEVYIPIPLRVHGQMVDEKSELPNLQGRGRPPYA